MRVLVVDDERRARERLIRILRGMLGIDVAGEASNGVTALEAISKVGPDAVFLDVQMPGLTGFDVLSELPDRSRPFVVFVTAHDQYAFQAFDVAAVDYLVKPVTADRVALALQRVRDRDAQGRLTRLADHIERTRPVVRIVGKLGEQLQVIPIGAVEAFQAKGEEVFAVTGTGRFVVDRTMERLEGVLNRSQFIRVHRQAIVNLDKVTVVEPIIRGGATVQLRCGQTVGVSRRYLSSLRQTLGW